MESERFDQLTRALVMRLPRRTLAGLLGLGTLAVPGLIEAKKKRKKKVKKNQFGCVDVGKFCKNGGQCCSGICSGKKGKKKCQAHDQTTCQAGAEIADCGGVDVPCTTSTGDPDGLCFTTTGKAGYCFRSGDCVACTKDADCEPVCGPQAACILCASCSETGGTGCAGPSVGSCIVG